MIDEKFELCPNCNDELSQKGYDLQFHECGWALLMFPSPPEQGA